jgi:hypothetical protein
MDDGVDAGMIEMGRCGRRVARRSQMFVAVWCGVLVWKQQSVVGRMEVFL